LLKDLRYAVRGGRLPNWVKLVADLFRVTPLICVSPGGRISLSGFLLGGRNRITRFARFVAAKVNSGESIEMGIGHAICPDDAATLAAEFRRILPTLDALKICDLGTGIGVHGGPGTLLVSTRPAVSANDFAVDVD
jgi:fatty acid-binding protein DegV